MKVNGLYCIEFPKMRKGFGFLYTSKLCLMYNYQLIHYSRAFPSNKFPVHGVTNDPIWCFVKCDTCNIPVAGSELSLSLRTMTIIDTVEKSRLLTQKLRELPLRAISNMNIFTFYAYNSKDFIEKVPEKFY